MSSTKADVTGHPESLLSPAASNVARRSKQMNAVPMLERTEAKVDSEGGATIPRAIAMGVTILQFTLLALVSWGLTISLILGGCCSNV